MTLRPGDVVGTHAEYERRHEDDADMEVAYEADRRAMWARAHDGSLDGYRPAREFPCLGVLRVSAVEGLIAEVACSACRFETTARVETRPRDSAGVDW